MIGEAEMNGLLDPKKLPLPARPLVEKIDAEHYEDSSGEESLEIWVILDDATNDDDLTGENVVQVKSAIHQTLLAHGIRLFPYIRLIKRSDYSSQANSE